MSSYKKLDEILLLFGIDYELPYYISNGRFIEEFPQEPFRMDFYAICLCKSGEILLEIDGNPHSISQNQFLISAPSTTISFYNTAKDFEMRLLMFDKNFIVKNTSNPFLMEDMNLFGESSYNIPQCDEDEFGLLMILMDYLEQTSLKKGKFIEGRVTTTILNILFQVAEITSENYIENKAGTLHNLFFQFTELVRKDGLKNKDVEYYANRLCISNKHLIRIVKDACGKTPHEIIDENLLKEAFVLLGNPAIDISETAFRTGFNSASAFSRFFKKMTAQSPSEYRKELFS